MKWIDGVMDKERGGESWENGDRLIETNRLLIKRTNTYTKLMTGCVAEEQHINTEYLCMMPTIHTVWDGLALTLLYDPAASVLEFTSKTIHLKT